MGNLLSVPMYITTSVICYKCPPTPDYDDYDEFLYQDPYVVYSTDAPIITIEEADY